MSYETPGTAELRAFIEPCIKLGRYPETRSMTEEDVDRLETHSLELLQCFNELLEEEVAAAEGEIPQTGSPWAEVRAKLCDVLQKALVASPWLIAIAVIQEKAIDVGAIPEPGEDSRMRYYRLPDWEFAHWECGTPIEVQTVSHSEHFRNGPGRGAGSGGVCNEQVPYCPTCEKAPSPHGAPVYI